MKWNLGVEFQIVALQAVMAALLEGDTIHHACGIQAFQKKDNNSEDIQMHMDIAKKVLQWRWLIIDEISMVSSKLLAELDVKLRNVIRDKHTAKYTDQGRERPFGGLNIICSGDFWQLDPPDGGFLASIPCEYLRNGRKFEKAPTIAHGQSLFWGGSDMGIQGVTELVECERTDDVWLRSLQEEFRQGKLSEENYRFLHGLPTKVPGSWLNGDVACNNSKCRELVKAAMFLKHSKFKNHELYVVAKECRLCKEERRSKNLVAETTADPRFRLPKFAEAPAIFQTTTLNMMQTKKEQHCTLK